MQMQEGGEEMMTKNAAQQIEEAEHKAKEYQALAVEQAKKLLSDAERQTVMLHAVAGLRHRESAVLLEMPLATVLSKYARAVKKLKQAMEADGR